MTKRIKIETLLSPAGIYQPNSVPATGYKPSEGARFGVVRPSADSPWRLVHLASGAGVDSILPSNRRVNTMGEKLAVAAAWDAATHIDWRDFDALPAVTLETTEPPMLCAPNRETIAEMRRLVAQVLEA